MDLQNTTLDDLAAVIGFTATLRLAAWFGDRGNLYIPEKCEEGQLLVKLIGMSAAKKLTDEWGHQHLNVPRPTQYETDLLKRKVGRMLEHGMRSAEVANSLHISLRRVQQICRELEMAGLIEILGPEKTEEYPIGKGRRKIAPEMGWKNPGENAGENAGENMGELPTAFFGRRKADQP